MPLYSPAPKVCVLPSETVIVSADTTPRNCGSNRRSEQNFNLFFHTCFPLSFYGLRISAASFGIFLYYSPIYFYFNFIIFSFSFLFPLFFSFFLPQTQGALYFFFLRKKEPRRFGEALLLFHLLFFHIQFLSPGHCPETSSERIRWQITGPRYWSVRLPTFPESALPQPRTAWPPPQRTAGTA